MLPIFVSDDKYFALDILGLRNIPPHQC